MTESISATDRTCPQSRATAILGLVALVLLQFSVAAHQFEHSTDHGFNVCDVCTAYGKLDDAPLAGNMATEFPIVLNGAVDTFAETPTAALIIAAYRSRAPPLS
jgi:hypothetical protein